MRLFKDFTYVLINLKTGREQYGSGGIRTYMTIKAAQRQIDSCKWLKDCKIARAGYEILTEEEVKSEQ